MSVGAFGPFEDGEVDPDWSKQQLALKTERLLKENKQLRRDLQETRTVIKQMSRILSELVKERK